MSSWYSADQDANADSARANSYNVYNVSFGRISGGTGGAGGSAVYEGGSGGVGEGPRFTIYSQNTNYHAADNDENLTNLIKVLDKAIKRFGERNSETIKAREQLGLAYQRLGEHDQAYKHLKQVVDYRIQELGSGADETVEAIFAMEESEAHANLPEVVYYLKG